MTINRGYINLRLYMHVLSSNKYFAMCIPPVQLWLLVILCFVSLQRTSKAKTTPLVLSTLLAPSSRHSHEYEL